MNKAGIAEIKKTFKPDKTSIDFMVTAFVSHDEDGAHITSFERRRLLAMEDAAVFKYLDVVKSTFGGKFDKNLLNIGFPTEAEQPGGAQDVLLKLRDSKLEEGLAKDYIQTIADTYNTAEHLMVTMFHGVYDIPVKTKDKQEVGDSEEVFDYIICSICPMKLEKPGIYFDGANNCFETVTQKLIVDKPVSGFLFPAFNDRSTDLHEMLFFAKKADEIHPEFINKVSGQKAPLPADVQRNIFDIVIQETIGKTNFDEERAIHEKIGNMIDARKYNEQDLFVSKDDIYDILNSTIGSVDEITFTKAYEAAIEGYDVSEFSLVNLVDAEAFKIEMADIQVKVKPNKTEVIERKEIDGQDFFLIPVYEGGVEINGKPIA